RGVRVGVLPTDNQVAGAGDRAEELEVAEHRRVQHAAGAQVHGARGSSGAERVIADVRAVHVERGAVLQRDAVDEPVVLRVAGLEGPTAAGDVDADVDHLVGGQRPAAILLEDAEPAAAEDIGGEAGAVSDVENAAGRDI